MVSEPISKPGCVHDVFRSDTTVVIESRPHVTLSQVRCNVCRGYVDVRDYSTAARTDDG